MTETTTQSNLDPETIAGFGQEWKAFDQTALTQDELRRRFDEYFSIFRWDLVNGTSVGFDMGCGSGRWARLLAPRVRRLHCVDPSSEALEVARNNLRDLPNVTFHHGGVDSNAFSPSSMDFGVSLGVLHHVPDTARAVRSCVELLKPGAPLLLYLYYRFDNRPSWFRTVWKASDLLRQRVSRLPFAARKAVASGLAATVYWPLSRLSRLLERAGQDVSNIPLSYYRNESFYTLKTDSLDRFGTKLEQRFTRQEIGHMLEAAGCTEIRFSESAPFWCVCAVKRR